MILKYGKLMKFQWKIYISIYFIMSKMNGFIVQVYFLIWKLKLFPCWRQTLLIHLVSIKKDNMRSKLFSSEVIYDLIYLLGFFLTWWLRTHLCKVDLRIFSRESDQRIRVENKSEENHDKWLKKNLLSVWGKLKINKLPLFSSMCGECASTKLKGAHA